MGADPSGAAASVGAVTAAPPEACSTRSAAVGEPLAGTAVTDDRGCCSSSRGRGVRGSRRAPASTRRSRPSWPRAARRSGSGLALLRRTVAREDVRPRTAFLACTRRGATWVERHGLEDPADALRLDLDALGAGRPTDAAARWTRDVFAVCAARRARPLLRAPGPAAAPRAARGAPGRDLADLAPGRPPLRTHAAAPAVGRLPGARPGGAARAVAATLEAGRVPVDLCAAASGTRGRSRPPRRSCGPSAASTRLDDVEVRRRRGPRW